MWDRLERLPRGEKIKIRIDGPRWERCEFAGATDEFLYCAPSGESEIAQAWQIDRPNVNEFKPDHDVRNGRLIVTVMAVAGGLWTGIASWHSSRTQEAETRGILRGLIGTGLGALVGAPLSCLSGYCVQVPELPLAPAAYGIGVNLPLRRFPGRWRR